MTEHKREARPGIDAVPGSPVLTMTVLVCDRGPEPEYHRDRRLFGPWPRYEARLAGNPAVRALGFSAFDAVYRLVASHRSFFEERCSPAQDDRDGRP